ncbi:MAG: hypothetical protein HGA59_00570 [Chlorobiaceae bacterium]|nr:hypothetical protein [Chlorobiaceae bacterium]NTV15967.1 hypothetical protein [Chlorobiaceae bacterium]
MKKAEESGCAEKHRKKAGVAGEGRAGVHNDIVLLMKALIAKGKVKSQSLSLLGNKNKFAFNKIKSYYVTFLMRGEYAKKGRREIQWFY